MRDLRHIKSDRLMSGADGGAWKFLHHGIYFHIIASWGEGWDHVSISTSSRCPTWDEMVHFKDLFFAPDECVLQYHPSKRGYINCHPYCLHLWRPQHGPIPMPPAWMVGPPTPAATDAAEQK